MANNKIQLSNGTVLIDLSADTVTSAEHIKSGLVGHLADGSSVTGTLVEKDVKSVTYNLTGGATASVSTSEVVTGQGFSVKLKAPAGYDLSGVSITMGGVDITSQVFSPDSSGGGSEPVLDTKTITANGTYTASDDDLDGYSEVTVAVPATVPDLQTKTKTYTPTTSTQTETVTADSGYDGLQSVGVTVNPIPSQYIVPSGTKTISANGTEIDVAQYANVDVAVPASGVEVKTKTGTFTGNGTRQVTIPCDFEPDLIYWTSDPGTSASSGTVAGIIAREMMSANRYRNNSTSNSHYAVTDITAMNTGGSSYSFRATYSSGTVTLYCFSSNARSLFTNGRTYTYKFVKWTT